MSITTTTQPTMAGPAKTRAPWMAVGIAAAIRQFHSIAEWRRQRRQRAWDALTRDQQIVQFAKEQRLHCNGRCPSCEHTIRDVFGD